MRAGESLREASAPTTLLTTKTKTRIGTWDIQTLYEAGKTAQVCSEMQRYKLKILGLCETRWTGTGRTRLTSGDTMFYSGYEEGQPHMHGVALLTTPEATRALLSWESVSPRIITARFNFRGRKVEVLQCYAPTNTSSLGSREEFYEQIQATIDKIPKRDLKILMGDLNAKVGPDSTDKELIMGRHGVGEQNENGELFSEFCMFNDLVIGGTFFPHKPIHKKTWKSPDRKTENQIDHITIDRKWRRSLHDVRVKRGAGAATDHFLVVSEIQIKFKAYKDQGSRPSHKFNVNCLKENGKVNEFSVELKNKLCSPAQLQEENIEDQWHHIQEVWKSTCSTVLEKKKKETQRMVDN